MRRQWIVGLVVGILAVGPRMSFSAEHGGQEHAGQEHAGTTQEHGGMEHTGQAVQAAPSAEQIRQAIRDYVAKTEKSQGSFTIKDEKAGATRTLTLVRVHERVGKTGSYYYSCTDMRDAKTGDLLDLDYDVDAKAGSLNVVDVRIHKLNGQARYTYDDKDNRVPLP